MRVVAAERAKALSLSVASPHAAQRVAVGTAVAAAALGAAIPLNGTVVLVPVGLILLLCAWRWPTTTVALAIVAAALHNGIYLALRINAGGAPLSLYDIVPPLIVVSALSIRQKEPAAARAVQGTLKLVLVVVGAGTALGALIGFAEANTSYLIVQALRLELQLFLVLVACLTAGSSSQWREAVVRGVVWGGILAAVEILVDFFFTVLTGSSFWSLFPFGEQINSVQRLIASGNLSPVRQNPVSAFLLLPPLALVATRLGPRDGMLTGLFLAAGVVWLSRSFWAAVAATVALVLVFRLRHGSSTGGHLLRRVAPLVPMALVLVVVASSILERRFQQATSANVSNNPSNQFRAAETQAALDRVVSSPFHFVFGLGTGTLIVHPYIKYRAAPSALLENGVLSEWVNGGLAVMLGSALLFFGAGVRGWRLAARAGPTDVRGALGLLSLALPVLWLEGLAGGTLTLIEPATILWLLAGTAVAQRPAPGDRLTVPPRVARSMRDYRPAEPKRRMEDPTFAPENGLQPRAAPTGRDSVF